MPAAADIVQQLHWDSRLFGYPVTRIDYRDCRGVPAAELAQFLHSRNIRLAYFVITGAQTMPHEELVVGINYANSLGGRLVDRKTTLTKELPQGDGKPALPPEVTLLENRDVSADLIDLALASGAFSRFKLDKNFRQGEFENLYTVWITRSVKREIADAVYIIRPHNDILGLITLASLDRAVDIGLLAVAGGQRGKGYGRALVEAASFQAAQNGLGTISVKTQLDNAAAVAFYRGCGFSIAAVDYIFHVWIGDTSS